MYDIPEKTYRVLDALGQGGLNDIATEVYGRRYEATDGDANGTYYEVDATEEYIAGYDLEAFNDVDDVETIACWLSKPAVDWGYRIPEDYFIPGPQVAIVDLVLKGHLPHGVYLVKVEW